MSTTWYRGQTLQYRLAVTTTDPDDPDAPATPLSLDNLASLQLRVKVNSEDDDPPLVVVDLSNGWVVRAQTGGNVGVADLSTAADWLDALDEGTYHRDIRVEWNDGTVKFVLLPEKVKVKFAP